VVDTGIEVDGQSATPRRIEDNTISTFGEGVNLRNAPFAIVARNLFSGGDTGIRIRSGCLASDVVAFMTNGAKSGGALRRGGTAQVRDNIFTDVDTPHITSETSTVDSKFFGRCAVWEGDVVDGAAMDGAAFSNAVPGSGFNAKTWHKGDRVRNTTISSGVIYERICTSPGTHGAAGATTGSISSGSAVVSGVASWAGIGPGIYLMVNGQRVFVRSIDPGSDSFTTDFVFGSNASGVAISQASPAFADLYAAA
jgi:hypothetical protein